VPSGTALKSADGSVAIYVPTSGWSANNTSSFPSAVIGTSDATDSEKVLVTERSLPGITLNDYMIGVEAVFSGEVPGNLTWGPISSTTIDGCAALTVQMERTTKKGKVFVYWINAIQGKNAFYCLSAWMPQELVGQNKPVIESIFNSFTLTQ
jgi:hypothetical protein